MNSEPEIPAKEWDPQRRRALKIDIAVLLLVAVVPDVANAVLSLCVEFPSASVLLDSAGALDRSIRVGAVVLYMMWRSQEGWRAFGLMRPRWSDSFIGLLLYLIGFAAYIVWTTGGGLRFGFHAMPQEYFAYPDSTADYLLIGSVAIANGFVEEIAMTGLLLTRLERLWGSSIGALFATAAIAASYHVYGGLPFVVNAFIAFLIGGLWFVATRRLWPVIIAHMLADFLPFLISPG